MLRRRHTVLRPILMILPMLLAQGLGAARAGAVVAPRLDFLVVTVNGERQVVRDGETVKVVRGDGFEIERVAVLGAGAEAARVNLVGYSRPLETGKRAPKGPEDDQGVLVDTGTELKKKFSLDGRGDQYRVIAETAQGPAGGVTLQLLDPEFLYAEVLVNGKLVVARAGETLAVQPTDRIKVRRVVTNVFDDRSVRFQIDSGSERSEIQLFRGSNVFARIPLSASLAVTPVEQQGKR